MTLSAIRQQLEKLQTRQCALHHEQVRVDKSSGAALFDEVGSEKHYQRIGFCPASQRKSTIGCAHTSANDQFRELLDQIPETDGKLEALKMAFSQTISEIYLLDHHKGNLEKAQYTSADPAKLRQVSIALQTAKDRHRHLVNKLAATRSSVLLYLDKKIEAKALTRSQTP